MAEPELWRVIVCVEYVQCALCLKGFPSRGALTAGYMHVSDAMCFGTPLVEGVDIEANAKHPRVIASPYVSDLVRHHLTFYSVTATATYRYHRDILVAEDGLFFVNYLNAANYNGDYTDLSQLETHAALVRGWLNEFAADASVLSKYQWLAHYHNFFLDNCLKFTEEVPPDVDELHAMRIVDIGSQPPAIRFLQGSDARRMNTPPAGS